VAQFPLGGIEMTSTFADLSQRKAVTYLRILYPLWAVVGLFGIMYVPTTLIVPGDAAATANNLMANELLFNLGIISSLITQLIHIVVVLILYELFKSVSKNQASLIVVLGLVGVPIAMLNALTQVAALLVLSGADYLAVFTADQSQSLMMFFLNLNEQGILIASIFWGLWLFPIGTLTHESRYFPRIFGHLMILAGFGYLLGSLAHLLLPNDEAIFFQVFDLMTYGEVIFMLWFVVRGAKLPETTS
jgi:hypothetical protein